MNRPMAVRTERAPMAQRITLGYRLRVLLRRDWYVGGWLLPLTIIVCGIVL